MASFVSPSSSSAAPFSTASRTRCASIRPTSSSNVAIPNVGGLKFVPRIQIPSAGAKLCSSNPRRLITKISCSIAEAETLQVVQGIIAKQLSIDESSVAPDTKFADLGADSLDTVEIMMALEEKFGVSIGEGGAENIATVQDAADLIHKVKEAQP